MRARIIGIGQPMAGDDAAGIAAIAAIRAMGAPPQTELAEIVEPTALVSLLSDGADLVIAIDAAVDAGRSGRIVTIPPGKPNQRRGRLLSTHGLGVLDAIELAHMLHPDSIAKRIAVIGITISRKNRRGENLSPAVARAVRKAAAHAIALVRAHARKPATRRR